MRSVDTYGIFHMRYYFDFWISAIVMVIKKHTNLNFYSEKSCWFEFGAKLCQFIILTKSFQSSKFLSRHTFLKRWCFWFFQIWSSPQSLISSLITFFLNLVFERVFHWQFEKWASMAIVLSNHHSMPKLLHLISDCKSKEICKHCIANAII